jgi:predicted nucleic acid-binding protein
MCEGVYIDNDVVLKMCSYLVAEELVQVASTGAVPPAILAIAKFTLRSRVVRSRTIMNKVAVRDALEFALTKVRQIEPTQEEIGIAADLEQQAALLGLAFDAGESQLIAMLLERNGSALVTGDKRAITALARIDPPGTHGRIGCLEQFVASVAAQFGVDRIRTGVCAERHCDKAITASFACSSSTLSLTELMVGLRSYINSLRIEAGELLLSSDDLSAIVSEEHSVGCSQFRD